MAVPYMTIVEKTDKVIHMKRTPPFRSWLVFFALILLGAYAAYESQNLWLGSFYFVCGVALAHVAMDRWEECVLDRHANKVTLFHRSLFEVVFHRPVGQKVVSSLSDITNVRVESETLKYAGTTYTVALVFSSGFSLALTSAGTYGNKSTQEELVKEIKKFLGFKDIETVDVFDKKPSVPHRREADDDDDEEEEEEEEEEEDDEEEGGEADKHDEEKHSSGLRQRN